MLLRRHTCPEHTRVTRRDFVDVPSQQIKILSSRVVSQGGKYSDIKTGWLTRRTKFLNEALSISTSRMYCKTGPGMGLSGGDEGLIL
jgi:hypothetical protein